jgi:biotin synthase
MRFETSDPELFKQYTGGKSLERRLQGLRDLHDMGWEVGSGYMTGLPGETEEIRINNALLCQQLGLHMLGIGPFIPHPDTPLIVAEQKT